jgi:voltage-dependent anion channel protein 2
MATPLYKDLGKAAKDLIEKDFAAADVAVEVKSTTAGKVDIKSTGKIVGGAASAADVELKSAFGKYGIVATEKFSSDNKLTLTVESKDKIASGLTTTLETEFALGSGGKSSKLSFDFSKPSLRSKTTVDVLKPSSATTSVVFAYDKFLLGAEVDVGFNGKLNKFAGALAATAGDFAFTGHADGSRYNLSVLSKTANNVEYAVNIGYTKTPTITTALKFQGEGDSFHKVKVDSNGRVGVAHTFNLRQNVKFTAGAAFGGNAATTVGASFTINA